MLDTSTVTETPTAPSTPQRSVSNPSARLGLPDVVVHGLAWIAALITLEIIAPEADPNAVMAPYAVVLSMAFTLSLIWALVGLVRHERHGLWASVAGGTVMAIAAVTCGLEGHTGLWVPTQLILGLGLIALGRRSLARNA